MAIDNFIPEIWSAGVTQSFISNQVVIPTLNTQYSGDATRGNTVHIINATTPTIVDYAAAGRSITAEALADTEVQLLLNQEKAFSVNVDDVDKVQAAGTFNAWTDAAGKALAEDAETYLLAQMLAGATDGNGGGVVVDTAAEAKAAVLSIRTTLTSAKVPSGNRFIVVTPDFADLLLQGLSDVAAAGASNELRNGQITSLYGMQVLESPLLGSDVSAVGYHGDTVAFVNQIQSLEALRSQTSFSDIVRGLSVYGASVIKAAGVVKYVSA
jgi:hypothetical protein|tara:strand:- start:612 stop:1418 length:807 start_codon:yes stop_codon:yes gene_type:complete